MTQPRDLYLDGGRPARHQERCPCCKQRSAVFFASAGHGQSWFHCAYVYGKLRCDVYFVAASPKPLKRKVASCP